MRRRGELRERSAWRTDSGQGAVLKLRIASTLPIERRMATWAKEQRHLNDRRLSGALRSSPFRRFLAGRTISQWGDTFNVVAIVILVYRITGSGVGVSGVVAFEIAPVLLLGLVAGAWVDRLPRRRVMVGADLARAAVAGLLAAFHGQLWMVYGAASLLSSFSAFFNPAASSVVPALVGEDAVVGANSAVWSAAVISQIALAPAAGALVGVAGPGPAFAINAASFVVSAILLVGLPLSARPATLPARQLTLIRQGLRAIRSSRFLLTLAEVQTLAALSAGATSALVVVLAEDHLHVGAGRFGLLLGAIGLGAGIGPLVLQKLVSDVQRRGWLFGPYILRGAVDLTLANTANFGLAAGALAAYGLGTSTGNVTYNSVLQTAVSNEVRGRVFAFYDVVWQSARLMSIGLGGVLADALGITAVYAIGGALIIVAGLLGISRAGPPPGTKPAEIGGA